MTLQKMTCNNCGNTIVIKIKIYSANVCFILLKPFQASESSLSDMTNSFFFLVKDLFFSVDLELLASF